MKRKRVQRRLQEPREGIRTKPRPVEGGVPASGN